MKAAKLAVYLGGPCHGCLEWVEQFADSRVFPNPKTEALLESGSNPEPVPDVYRLAFTDDYVGIYYWRLNDFQVKAVRQQVTELRARFGEPNYTACGDLPA